MEVFEFKRKIAEVYRIAEEIGLAFRIDKCTPDGHLVGAFGQIAAKLAFGLEFGAEGGEHNCTWSDDLREIEVQVRCTGAGTIAQAGTEAPDRPGDIPLRFLHAALQRQRSESLAADTTPEGAPEEHLPGGPSGTAPERARGGTAATGSGGGAVSSRAAGGTDAWQANSSQAWAIDVFGTLKLASTEKGGIFSMGNKEKGQLDGGWGDWTAASGPEALAALQSIAAVCERLRESARDGYQYEHVSQTEFNSVTDELIKRGAMTSDGKVLKNIVLGKQFQAIVMYQNRAAYHMMGLLIATKQIGVVQLLDAVRVSIVSGNLLVCMICFRSILEHVAQLDSGIDELREFSVPSTFEEANATLATIKGKLVDLTYPTRVDWEKMAYGDSEDLIRKNKLKYKPNDLRQNRTAEQILDLIDDLNKKIKGIRGVYEILCEFAHPNVGLTLAVTKSVHPFPDKHGFTWIRKEVGFGPPVSTMESLGKIFCQIFASVEKSLVHFEKLIEDAESIRAKIQVISQVLLRRTFQNNKDILDPYAPCPCGTGMKIKFCCGAKVH